MKLKNKILFVFLFVGMIFLFNNISYAGTQNLKSLNYDVQLNEDGSMNVVETWNIYVSETNTLFKDFNLDSSKYSEITNVSVEDLDRDLVFEEIDTEMYHVTKDCFYGLEISGNKFEIAWGVGLDDSSATKQYRISYTVEDVVKVYNDCSELYWQFVGTDNGVPADKVTGKIHLPKAVNNIDNLRVWAHGPLNGEIQKEDNQTVWFEVKNFDSQTMLETRIVVEEDIFSLALKKVNYNKLDDILKEETEWADEANRQRQKETLFLAVIMIVYLVVFVWFFTRILKYRRQMKEMPESFSKTVEVGEYFRDIPRENLAYEPTPAQAAYLYYSKNNSFYMDNSLQHVFSGTLLDLCLKGYISFDCEDKKDIVINILNDKFESKLANDEQSILKLLIKLAGAEKSISMSKLKKYAEVHYDGFAGVMNTLSKEAKKANEKNGNYNVENEKIKNSFSSKIALYVFAIMFTIVLASVLIPIYIEWIIAIIYLARASKKVNLLTEQGEIERQQWKGLQKYMKEFSLLKEKDIPDLVLWEKYLVYATTFGISKEVIKQLKVVYPEFNDLDRTRYSYMYLMADSRFEHGFVNTFNDSVQSVYKSYEKAYNIAHSSSSSGSGGGGGFSGGGGGRRWRRPEWAEDKFNGEKYENWYRYWR